MEEDADHLAHERREQFTLKYPEYRQHVFRYTLSLTRNETEAEEIADEVIFRFYKSMDGRRWQFDVQNVKAYLLTIARKVCVEWWRRPKGESLAHDDDEQSEQLRGPLERLAMSENDHTRRLESEIYYKELLRRLPKNLLAKLSEYELQLLRMHAVWDYSTAEIADELGKTEERVRYDVTKLMGKLRYRGRQFER